MKLLINYNFGEDYMKTNDIFVLLFSFHCYLYYDFKNNPIVP